MADLTRRATEWMDQWFDTERSLLWNPPMSFSDDLAGRDFHVVPQNAWYVLGLLERQEDGDVERACGIVDELVSLQYDAPGTPWHGTYARFAETPEPTDGAVEWEDYDPNWRQFLGTALTVALRRYPDLLPAATAATIEATVRFAVAGEPDDRLTAHYTNIALKHAWLQVEWGDADRGEELAEQVVELFDRTGAFFEFNSPTYYGIDLWGLALWREHSASKRLRDWGARLEASLWRSAAAYYHAGLRNMAAPYFRSYGMDMQTYMAQLGLWVWEGLGEEFAPVPDITRPFGHSHDLCFGPCPAALGVVVPDDAAPHFRAFTGERLVETPISTGRRGRTATAWLADEVMLGGEAGGWDMGDWDQFVAGAVHWRKTDGSVGWLRVRQPNTPGVVAEPGVLRVAGPCRLLAGDRPLESGHHDLDGITLDITTAGDETVIAVA